MIWYGMIWYCKIWYDIYLLQLDFHPVAAVGKLVQKEKTDSYIQKEKQYTKQYKTKNTQIIKHTKTRKQI